MIFSVSAPSGLITMDDMVLTTDQYNDMFGMGDAAGVRAAVAMSPGRKDRNYRWPNNKLFYDFDNVRSSVKTKVRNTLNELEKKLNGCIHFQERSHGDRLMIKNSKGCSATLGYYANKKMTMNLSVGSGRRSPVIENEVLHSLGIMHTHHSSLERGHI